MRRSTNKNTVCIEGAPIRTQYKSAGRRKKLRTWQNLFNCACTSKMALHFQQMGEGGGAGERGGGRDGGHMHHIGIYMASIHHRLCSVYNAFVMACTGQSHADA